MRIAICALSAVLLSGCSWLGMGGNGHHGAKQAANGYYGAKHSGQYGQQARQHDPCQIMAPTQPIPRGCAPHQVTLGAQNGFPQQPNFGSGQYASGGYGSHAGNAQQHAGQRAQKPGLRKPKFRGQMSMGFEKSNSGNYLDYTKLTGLDPAGGYNPDDFAEGFTSGSPSSGNVTTTVYSGVVEQILQPNVAFDDVHSTPFRVAGGLEYIFSPRTTAFANAGYSYAEGTKGGGASVIAEAQRRVTSQDYDTATGNPIGGPVTNIGFIPNQEIATFSYNFTDMARVDLEVGARHYLNPILKSSSNRSITPFVGVSAGASHYNSQSFDVEQRQVFYERQFNSGGDDTEFYDVPGPPQTVDVYNSQWVPSGQINAGLEWQMTPKTALAFETGVKIEGGREYTNGEKGDTNVAIPVTIRGSYNF